MNTNAKQSAPIGDVIKFNAAKVTLAQPATARQEEIARRATELGAQAAEGTLDWSDLLKLVKSAEDRAIAKSHFMASYLTHMQAAGKRISQDAARKAFDRKIAEFAPQTSRKAKSNAKRAKGGGRKEKTATGKGETLAPQVTAQRLAAVLHYIAKAQQKYMGDDDVLEVLGEIAAIAGGKRSK